MMKKYLLTTTLLFSVFGLFAQNHEQCGTNHILEQQLQNPETQAKYSSFQEAILRYTQDPNVTVNRDENGVRIIPVVFHILQQLYNNQELI